MKRIAVFASGNGSNFVAIHSASGGWETPAKIVLLVSNNPDCGAVKYARAEGIPVEIINKKRFGSQGEITRRMQQVLSQASPHLLVLAGYMKMIPSEIIREYRRRIMNIHPALLPAFGGKGYYGMNVHHAVIEKGVKLTGVTVHFVDEIYDNGPVIAQEAVAVEPDDTPETLAAKVLKVEHWLYPRVVKEFCSDGIQWINGHPWIRGWRNEQMTGQDK